MVNIKRRNITKGFTLIELTVSMGILAIIVGLTAGVLISVVKSYQRQKIISEIERNGDFIVRTLEENMRGATGIACTDLAGNVITTSTTCTLGSGRLLRIDGDAPKYLGRGSGTSANCAANSNCNTYLLTSIGQVSGTTLSNTYTKLTNDATTNGVNVSSFVVDIRGGGSAGAPLSITVTIDIKGGPDNSTSSFAKETRRFQSFLTLRGSYQ